MDCHGSSAQMPGISEKRLREGKKKGRNARIFRGGRFTAGNGRHQEYAFKNEYPPPEANAQDRMEPVKKVLICLFVQQNAVTARSSPFFIIMVRFEMEPSFFIYIISIGSCFSKECLNIMFMYIPPSAGFITNEQTFRSNSISSPEKAASNQRS